MSEIYNIDFEAGDFSELTADSTGGAQLYVSSTDAINGTYSANHDWSTSAQVVSNSTSIPTPFTAFRVGFKIKIKAAFSFGTVTTAAIFNFLNGATEYSIRITQSGSDVVAALFVNGIGTLTSTTNLDDGAIHTIEMRAVREVAAGNDGIHGLYVDGLLEVEDTGVDNDSLFSDVRIGFQNWQWARLSGGATGETGGIITDDWILRDDDTQIYPPTTAATDEFTATPMVAKPCDIDSDGSNIYIGVLNSLGFPVLIQFATALNADGSVIFEPGSGDNIGVECSRGDADEITIAGQFDGTNVIERSEDAGSSFSVIDDGTIGGISAFRVGPDSDDRILVADEDNDDLIETIDGGATWSIINSSVTPTIRAIGRLGQNVQETVFGNESAASDNVDYSINSGVDLEDYSGGFPETDVNGVIIN